MGASPKGGCLGAASIPPPGRQGNGLRGGREVTEVTGARSKDKHRLDGRPVGEIFMVETMGTAYCGDFNFAKFNAGNNVDLFMRIDSENQLTVSFTSAFEAGTTFPMVGTAYLTSKTTAAFVVGVLFPDGTYAMAQGIIAADKFGNLRSLKGTFIQFGVLRDDCFSAGTFTSVRRLQ